MINFLIQVTSEDWVYTAPDVELLSTYNGPQSDGKSSIS